jgi:hypothetical protein
MIRTRKTPARIPIAVKGLKNSQKRFDRREFGRHLGGGFAGTLKKSRTREGETRGESILLEAKGSTLAFDFPWRRPPVSPGRSIVGAGTLRGASTRDPES